MKLYAIDTETFLSQPGLAAPPIVCFSIADESGSQLLNRVDGLAWLKTQLVDPEAHLIGCNIVYDLANSIAADPNLLDLVFAALDADRIHDVGIREALIDIARGDLVERGDDEMGIRYGMTLLAERYLGVDLTNDKKGPDSWRKRYALLDGVPFDQWPEEAKAYPLRDAVYPLAIFKAQEGQPNLHDESNQVRAAFALQLMSVWGMRSNGNTVLGLAWDCAVVDAKCVADFQESGILRPDGSENRKRLAELVREAYGGSPPMTAPTGRYPQGQISSDRDTLAESGSKLLETYAKAGKNDKFLTTYLPILEQGIEQPWNPQFNVLVATTRVSSNAQQFPQRFGVRECWEARPGHVCCSVDYGGLELRTMAQRAIWSEGYSNMADVLNAGRDAHVIASASFQGLNYEEALARYSAGESLAKAFRDLGKVWNFGKGGGMGPAAMVYNSREGKNGQTTVGPDGTVYVGTRFCLLVGGAKRCGVTKVGAVVRRKRRRICAACLAIAKQLDAGWLAAWPEQRALSARASRMSKKSHYLDAVIPMSKVVRGKCGYTQWLNTPFQGLGAAATKRAMWMVCREMYTRPASPLYGSRLLLNVHDELIAEMPEDVAPEAGDRMAKVMREVLKRYVPDLAQSVEAEPALSRTLAKGAKTVRDASGRLQVWSP